MNSQSTSTESRLRMTRCAMSSSICEAYQRPDVFGPPPTDQVEAA